MGWMVPIVTATGQQHEEEQVLAALIKQDQEDRYEFKVLHGGFATFRDKERLQQILDEEARAQWELAMKLDDARIVLRRPRTARSRDVLLGEGIDPYRTQLRGSSAARNVVLTMVALLLALGFGLALQREMGNGSDMAWPVIMVAALIAGILAIMLIARR